MKKVTIAIPTYNRPQYLKRALESVAQQNYSDLEVLVSDNCTKGEDVEKIISEYYSIFDDLKFFKQDINIGPINNFMFLLEKAKGNYFMWLADDDEMSGNCVEHLVSILDNDSLISCVAANWYKLESNQLGSIMPGRNYSDAHWLIRVSKYIWSSSDVFFYGMFRTEQLRKARVIYYIWPNNNEIINWAYVYLYDIILAGKVLTASDESVRFINHSYVEKSYPKTYGGIAYFLKLIIRRANVYWLYIYKTFTRKHFSLSFLVIVISITSFISELSRFVVIKLYRIIMPKKQI